MRDPRPPERPRGYDTAPVITHEGTWGSPPPPYRDSGAGHGSEARAWLTIALAALLVLWLSAFSLAQVTSRGVAIPAAQRALASLSEVDALIAVHAQELCAAAGRDSTIELEGFPVHDVTLLGTQVQCSGGQIDRPALRTALLLQGADLTYLRGAEALTDPGRSAAQLSPFSGAGLTSLLFDVLTVRIHEQAALASWGLGGLTLLLLLAVLLVGRGGRLNRVAAAALLAALPVALGAVALRFLVTLLRPEDGVLADVVDIIRSLAWLPARNGLILALAGLALALPALLRRRRDPEPDDDDDFIEYRAVDLAAPRR